MNDARAYGPAAAAIVTDVIVAATGLDPATCRAGRHDLFADLGIDSLALSVMVATLQTRLGIVVPDESTARWRSVQDVHDAVATILGSHEAAHEPKGET